ncbi:DUF6088 family protein [Candidatus Odyssella thessalonicensis]|uniref:DUF6088 family protein n=1 Tax=Candidatus Odyssella thessalonicensis TaxID=84647 RepID=UPI000225AC8A|nr:DUF6088 family protein [Candidatus Odyssella thessalonicensis]
MSVARQIKGIISQLPLGSVFCANDFADLGTLGNIDVIFHRLSSQGSIRKIGYGLYDRPRKSPILGDLKPNIDQIISAYARKMGQLFVLDPLNAANVLGITTQVPSKLVYLTDGKTHHINVCGIDIYFIHKSPKAIAGASKPIGIILQALRYIGSTRDDKTLQKIAARLTIQDLNDLQEIKNKTFRNIGPQIDRIQEIATLH